MAEVARVLGHQQLSTTYRYTNADQSMLQRAAAIFDAFQEQAEAKAELIN